MGVQIIRGKRFAAVAGHPMAAEAATKVMRNGGNVVDAAIAGAAVLAVVLPHACTLGGDCFALLHLGGITRGINGSGMSPAKLPRDVSAQQLANGPLSCSVPGALGAWEAMHQGFGRTPWRELLAPAIGLARNGVPVAGELAGAMRGWLEPLRRDPGCRTLFLKEDQPYAADEILRQTALAGTLDAIASGGGKALYLGDIGRKLCRGLAAAGSVLDLEDLAGYAPEWVDPLEYVYRGHAVRVMPPNSWGLFMLLQLAGLEGTAFGNLAPGSAKRLSLLINAARASFALGSEYVADPREVKHALSAALAPAMIHAMRAAITAPVGDSADLPRSKGTAVISVADSQGDGVTIVQSVFMPFGSVVADPTTGIVMNNRLFGFVSIPGHPNAAAPSKRPAHTLNPVMVLKDRRLRLLMGTPGGSGQTITLTQVLSNILDHGLDLSTAVAAPRWSMDLKGNLLLEPDLGEGVAEELAGLDLHARVEREQRAFFGSAECIQVGHDGLIAVADFRRNAGAAAN